ncbi:MAG: VOC family protein [Rhodocyclaceae bacterium]|nr:VOC family protein [Rhodocyclaceae bacterium]
MIQRQSHASVFVLDQDRALAFYRDKLGFEVRTDMTMDGGFRWLTVGPRGQPDFQLILISPSPGPMFDEDAATQLRALVEKGVFGIGVFETADCQATFEALQAEGVSFLAPPTERFYGIEAMARDDSGNWFSITQRRS